MPRLLFAERKKLMRRSLTVAMVVVTLSLAFFSFRAILGGLSQTLTIGSRGTIQAIGVEVYGDINCNSPVPSVDWGTVEPGSTKNFTIYIKNTGNVAVTLFVYADNWNPPDASNYMTFSPDYPKQPIDPQEVVEATLTLSTSPDIEGITSFNFDIFIEVNE